MRCSTQCLLSFWRNTSCRCASFFLPRDAMYSAAYVMATCLSARPSRCLSRLCIVSKWLYIIPILMRPHSRSLILLIPHSVGCVAQNFGDWCKITRRLRWCGRNRNQCRIPIWRTFGRIKWHAIPAPPATLANSMSWFQSYVSHCRVLPSGEFNGMSSQSHVSHCRVLPLGEFTVTIQEPHATLQGVIIPSAILKIVSRHILFIYCF